MLADYSNSEEPQGQPSRGRVSEETCGFINSVLCRKKFSLRPATTSKNGMIEFKPSKPKESLSFHPRDALSTGLSPWTTAAVLEPLLSGTRRRLNLLDVAAKIQSKPPKHCMFSYIFSNPPLQNGLQHLSFVAVVDGELELVRS